MPHDIQQAMELINLFVQPDEIVTFQTFAENGDDYIPKIYHKRANEFSIEFWEELIAENEKGGVICWMVQGGDGKGRKEENVTRIRAVYVDLDHPGLKVVMNSDCPPHAVVETSPGKHHCYWKIAKGGPRNLVRLLTALAVKFNADPGVCDVARSLRLPGFMHFKGQPFMSRIVSIDDMLPAYSFAQLRDGLSLSVGETKKLKVPMNKITVGIPEGQRHNYLLGRVGGIASATKASSLTAKKEAVFVELMEANDRACDPPLSEKEVRKISDWAAEKDGVDDPFKLASQKSHDLGGVSVSNLMSMDIPEITWVVKTILPVGVCLFIGDPKSGKTWMLMETAIRVGLGEEVFDQYPTKQCGVLCLALEDNYPRCRYRFHKVLDGKRPPDNVTVVCESDLEDDYLGQLNRALDANPGIGLVYIDTLGRLRYPETKGGVYRAEYEQMAKIQSVALQRNISILVAHHTNKNREAKTHAEATSGSHGLSGASDVNWWLRSEANEDGGKTGVLVVGGKDVEEAKLAIRFDSHSCRWLYEGETWKRDQMRAAEEICAVLKWAGHPLTLAEISKETGKTESAVRKTIERMNGKVTRLGVKTFGFSQQTSNME